MLGKSDIGQVGIGASDGGVEFDSPQVVGGLGKAAWVSAGEKHYCACSRTGRVACWVKTVTANSGLHQLIRVHGPWS